MTTNTLHLTLKRRWFEDIIAGRKTEEYREDKPYWRRRILPWAKIGKGMIISFRNGYSAASPRILVECLGVENRPMVVEGLGNGQKQNFFVLKLGRLFEYSVNGNTFFNLEVPFKQVPEATA